MRFRLERLGGGTARGGVVKGGFGVGIAEGIVPGATGWVPTYNTNGAIAEVWSQKAALVAGDYTFSADEASFDKGDLLAHMLAMESKYAALAVDVVGRTVGGASTLTVAGTNGPFDPVERVAARVIP